MRHTVMDKATTIGLILADESNEEFHSSIPKYQMSLNGKKVIEYSRDGLAPHCDDIIVIDRSTEGDTRFARVWKVISALADNYDHLPELLLIHDASYPFIKPRVADALKNSVTPDNPYAACARPIDGILFSEHELLASTKSFELQYPEAFCFATIYAAYAWATAAGKIFKCQADLLWSWKRIYPVQILGGQYLRIKERQDLAICEGAFKFADECIESGPEDLSLSNVLVLGGSGGIGSACIDLLQEKGARWYAPTRQQLDLATHDNLPDLSSFTAIINAAGAYEESPETIMRVNFLSCIELIAEAEATRWTGNIVLLSSTAATRGRKGLAAYSASKAALNTYIEAEAERLALKGIFINAVAPAKVDTRLQHRINPSTPSDDMIAPGYIAEIVIRYISVTVFGKIVYVRKGLDL